MRKIPLLRRQIPVIGLQVAGAEVQQEDGVPGHHEDVALVEVAVQDAVVMHPLQYRQHAGCQRTVRGG